MNKTFHALFLAALALIIAGSASSQESTEDAIRNRVKQFEAAYNAGDAEALGAIYMVDGTHTFALGFTLRGRDEIVKDLKEQFAGPVKGSRMSITPLHIRSLSPNVAVEEASFIISGLKDPGGADLPAFNGLCLVVYQKVDEAWFVAAAQCMIPPAMPQEK